MAGYFMHITTGWHPITAGPPKPDTGEFHPRPKEVLVVEIGPDHPAAPMSLADALVRELLRNAHDAWLEGGTVLICSAQGEAHFRVQAMNTEYRDMPQSLKWTARLLQTEPWSASLAVSRSTARPPQHEG